MSLEKDTKLNLTKNLQAIAASPRSSSGSYPLGCLNTTRMTSQVIPYQLAGPCLLLSETSDLADYLKTGNLKDSNSWNSRGLYLLWFLKPLFFNTHLLKFLIPLQADGNWK